MRTSRLVTAVAAFAALILVFAACSSGSTAKNTTGKVATPSDVPVVTPATAIISDTVAPGATRMHFEVGPLPITPGQNNISYSRAIPQPTEDGYIVGITSNLRLADGTVPPVDVIHLHHGVWLNLADKDPTSPGLPLRFYAAGEEKTRSLVPPGYGYAYKTSDKWLLNYMLHNQLSKPDQVWITYDIDMIPATAPEAKNIKPAIPVWMDVQNGSIYPVFDVLQGSGKNGEYTYPDDDPQAYACPTTDGQPRRRSCVGTQPAKNQWTMPYDATLLSTAGHLHPGGLHDDLWDTRAGATGLTGHTKPGAPATAHLFSSVSTYYEPLGPVSWDVAMSATPDTWRVNVKKGDVLSVSTTYDSKDGSWYESMGIMVVWIAPNEQTGQDPFTNAVDVQGMLTHGHLKENDNHGGQPDPKNFNDMTKLPSQVLASGTALPIADFAYQGDMSEAASVPTVVQGGTLVFRNDDSKQGIPHTITSCAAPCDLSTGIGYPVANGVPRFDSGELAQIGVPSNGQVSWSTPTDLPPGTYTYFCRIHPFMRGAFRVAPKA